jgi:hypothetical protein
MNRTSRFLSILVVGACIAFSAKELHAGQADGKQGMRERVSKADLVVHGKVRQLSARMDRNEFQDELIVTRAEVEISSVVKGSHSGRFVSVDLIGGTIHPGTPEELTLRSSAMEHLPAQNEEVLLLLNEKAHGVHELGLRGLGYFQVDPASKQVRGTRYKVEDIRGLAPGQR